MPRFISRTIPAPPAVAFARLISHVFSPSRSLTRLIAVFGIVIACAGACRAWEQGADYIITVTLDTTAHTIGGNEKITYYNNSSNPLPDLYLHLYWNAFQPGSMMEERMRESGAKGAANAIASLAPDECGSVDIQSLAVEGAPAKTETLGTILHVIPSHPIQPGASAAIEIQFVSHVPKFIRRAGYNSPDSVEYSMAQWYPKICAYDERGWHDDQYLGREFYGVRGRYFVNITAPRDYVLAGTGEVTNPFETGCGYGLAYDAYLPNPAARDTMRMNAKGQLIDTAAYRTWKFEAQGVHDFAWAADRDFVHRIIHIGGANQQGGTVLHVLYKKKFHSGWNYADSAAVKLLDYYGVEYGKYPYKNFTVVQAGDGGMEYPQIVFLRGGAPPLGTLAHEMAHQWFYGILGNNETGEALLDEGFTTFASGEAAGALFPAKPPRRDWLEYLFAPQNVRIAPYYLKLAADGMDEPVLEHSDAFRENATYNLVYNKTAAILEMLKYTVGDSVFQKIMQTYCSQYWLKHPTTDDFIRVSESVSGMNLGWFFDEWLRTTRTCDYSVDGVSSVASSGAAPDKSDKSGGAYRTTISLSNRGGIAMPLDLLLTYADGSQQTALIPVSWRAKSVPNGIVLPLWDPYLHSYTSTFETPQRVTGVVIDTSHRLGDINWLNNASGFFPPYRFGLYTQYQANNEASSPMDAYAVSLSPRAWYAQQQGAKIGFSLDGSYAYSEYLANAGAYFNTLNHTADWWLEYRTPIAPMLNLFGKASEEYGIGTGEIGAEKVFRLMYSSPFSQTLQLRVQYTRLEQDLYPFYDLYWSKGELNTVRFSYSLACNGTSQWHLHAEYESSLMRETAFIRTKIDGGGTLPLTSVFDFSFRGIVGTSGGDVPVQKLFYLAGASPQEQFENTVYRGIAGVSYAMDTAAHMLLPGGGNLPGYADQYAATAAHSIAAGDMELRAHIFRGSENFSVAAFGGAGWLSNDTWTPFTGIGIPRFDAGGSLRFQFTGSDAGLLQSFFETRAPLQLDLLLPVFVSQPLPGEQKVKFRFAAGISSGI